MALLPPHYLNAVVALGVPMAGNSVSYAATGFIYGLPAADDPDQFHLSLVTNRHVLEELRDAGLNSISVRFNRSPDVEPEVYSVPVVNPDGTEHWTAHPDDDCDVAVVGLNAPKLEEDNLQFAFFQGNPTGVVSEEHINGKQISEGDGVFILGFPMGLSGEQRNYPIVRQGGIARIQDWVEGHSRSILVDATIFPGNSGGPVCIKPEATAIEGTQRIDRALLIGMVSGYLPYEDVAISQQTKEPRVVFTENSGLAEVVPIDVIKETIHLLREKAKQ